MWRLLCRANWQSQRVRYFLRPTKLRWSRKENLREGGGLLANTIDGPERIGQLPLHLGPTKTSAKDLARSRSVRIGVVRFEKSLVANLSAERQLSVAKLSAKRIFSLAKRDFLVANGRMAADFSSPAGRRAGPQFSTWESTCLTIASLSENITNWRWHRLSLGGVCLAFKRPPSVSPNYRQISCLLVWGLKNVKFFFISKCFLLVNQNSLHFPAQANRITFCANWFTWNGSSWMTKYMHALLTNWFPRVPFNMIISVQTNNWTSRHNNSV